MTHQVSVDYDRQVVVKQFLGEARAEAAREWRALLLLAEHAPRLAPEPISADLASSSPPEIVMSLLPGEPLGGQPLTAPQEWSLAQAIGQLWQAVPAGLITPLPGELTVLARFEQQVRAAAAAAPAAAAAELVVRDALAAGTAWLSRAARLADASPARLVPADGPAVLGQGDAHLANFLWDGDLVRIVDFEDSGISDRVFELAVLVEHVSAWRDTGLDADLFTAGFDLCAAERARLTDCRRLVALGWLFRFLDRGDAGAVRHQAERLLSLL